MRWFSFRRLQEGSTAGRTVTLGSKDAAVLLNSRACVRRSFVKLSVPAASGFLEVYDVP